MELARQAAAWFEQAGQPSEIVALPEADFAAELSLQTFDLAFRVREIPLSAEPSWFFASDHPSPQPDTEGLPDGGVNRYDDRQSVLEAGWPFFKYLGQGLPRMKQMLKSCPASIARSSSNSSFRFPAEASCKVKPRSLMGTVSSANASRRLRNLILELRICGYGLDLDHCSTGSR